MSSDEIFPEKGSRFAKVTPDDHGGYAWIAALLSLIYAFMVLVVRVILKYRRFGSDDGVLVVGYAIGLAHWSLIFTALRKGLGRSRTLIGDEQEAGISQLVYASRFLFFMTLACSKCCLLLLIRFIFTEIRRNRVWWICNIGIVLALLGGLASALTVSVGCQPGEILRGSDESHCSGEATRWKVVIAYEILTEVAIVTITAIFLTNLQMRLERKSRVLIAFALRLPIIAFAGVSLNYLLRHLSSGRANIDIATSIAWQEAWLSYSIMSATIPTLKGFIKSFTTAGLPGAVLNTVITGQETHTGGGSFALTSMRSDRNIRLRPETVGHVANAYPGRPNHRALSFGRGRDEIAEENGSTASKGSKEMIIKKVVEWGISSS